MGIYCFFVNLFATTAASLLIGKIADRYSLLAGMHCAVAAQVASGLCFFVVIYLIRRHGLRHRSLTPYTAESAEAREGTLAVPAVASVGATSALPNWLGR
jgi:hypothetical protein